MKSVSTHDLNGDAFRRWAKERREMYRSILRDPRTNPTQKAEAKKKLDATSR